MIRIGIALLFAVVCFGQAADDPMFTDSFANGRFWKAMNDGQKLAYLVAYKDGLVEGFIASGERDVKDLKSNVDALLPRNLTHRETLQAVTRFYDTPENAPIPIRDALEIVVLKADGVAQVVIDEVIADDRRKATNAGAVK